MKKSQKQRIDLELMYKDMYIFDQIKLTYTYLKIQQLLIGNNLETALLPGSYCPGIDLGVVLHSLDINIYIIHMNPIIHFIIL